MASRLPWFRMHQGDWLADLAGASLLVEGAWIRIVCEMRRTNSGTLEHPLAWWSRFLRTDVASVREVLAEIRDGGIGDVDLTDAAASVTSRRVVRDLADEEAEREQAADRARDYRERSRHARVTPASRSRHGEVTPESQSQSQSQIQKKTSPTPGSSSSMVTQPSDGLRAPVRAPEAEGRMGDGEKSEPPKPCSRCTEGFDCAAQRCCSCPAGRERARRVTSAAAADREQAQRASARSANERPSKLVPLPELLSRIAAKASPANATASRAPPKAQVDSRVDQRIATP